MQITYNNIKNYEPEITEGVISLQKLILQISVLHMKNS